MFLVLCLINLIQLVIVHRTVVNLLRVLIVMIGYCAVYDMPGILPGNPLIFCKPSQLAVPVIHSL